MSIPASEIAFVRAFNRDYTRRIGVLCDRLLDSPYSLTEGRVLYEIAQHRGVTAAELADELGLDRGYLSRLLKGFETHGLLEREASIDDGRRWHLRLTCAGKRAFEQLNRRSQQQVGEMLSSLDDARRRAVLAAMKAIQGAFMAPTAAPAASTGSKSATASGSATAAAAPEVSFRSHRPGDMGWVVERHGQLYHQEYGWNEEFEALVAEITAEFIRKLDPARERCWIVERDGRRLGCIFLVAKDRATAKLRLLLVEREARGFGVGRSLVARCVQFARAAGYRKIVLWTQENLTAARHLYTEAGFKRTAREPHHSFGHDLVAETWELGL